MNNPGNLFDGKVSVLQLPVCDPSKDPCQPTLKRLVLSKGELAQFHDSEAPIHYIACLELREGQTRGNHFHRVKQEHVYVMIGSILLRIRDLEAGLEARVCLEPGTLVRIDPGIAHVLIPLTNGYAVEFSPARFDAKDIHSFQFSGA